MHEDSGALCMGVAAGNCAPGSLSDGWWMAASVGLSGDGIRGYQEMVNDDVVKMEGAIHPAISTQPYKKALH